jgi:osmotically-inducible protein OsmY
MAAVQTPQASLIEFSRCDEQPWLTVEEQNKQAKGARTDDSIAEKVDRALRKNSVLRSTDYGQIDVAVKDGFVYLSGHVVSAGNQRRAEDAVSTIPGVLGIQNNLVADDQLILKVAGALGKIEHEHGVKFFTGSQNGVVGLHGDVRSASVRSLAEKCAASIPGVRGVINKMSYLKDDKKKEDQRFLQPAIGEQMYFRDGIPGTIQKVIINPNNLRVVAMVVRGRYSNPKENPSYLAYGEVQAHQRSVYIPMSAVRYLTKSSGFLTIDSVEASRSSDFDPSGFTAPGADWSPPYPYCPEDVLFPLEPVEHV